MNSISLVALLAVAATVSAGYGQQETVASPPVAPIQRQPSPPQPQPLGQVSSISNNQPAPTPRHIPILRFSQQIQPSESDSVEFETGNGIRSTFNTKVVRGRPSSYVDENGQTVQTDSTLEQNGHSYHEMPDGQHIALTWSADSEGFHPSGDHLPQPVQMPEEHAQAHREANARAQQQSTGSYAAQPTKSGY